MSKGLEITTLGGLTIQGGGTSLKGIISRKAEALLVYLACTRQPQPRTKLAELLWDERSEDLALSNLRTLITRLRPHLAPYLQINRDTISLNPNETLTLDLAELERGFASLRQNYFSEEAANQLEKALSLYQGDFLQNFYLRDASSFEEWVSQERERLHKLTVEAMQQLINFRDKQGNFENGQELSERLLQLDPLREESHRYYMNLLARKGQRSAALNHYKTYQRYLARELDIAPEAATTDLYERIKKAEIPVVPEKSKAVTLPSPSNKVAQLKRVSLFADTPETHLTELAKLLEEVEFKAGGLIFEKGDIGQCMYIIIEGQVRVYDGRRTLNVLGIRDVFGEMALLDTAPRLASVEALTDTRLWRLEQATLYQLMAGRIEVVRGIIKVLSQRLRERVQDVVDLEARLQSLSPNTGDAR